MERKSSGTCVEGLALLSVRAPLGKRRDVRAGLAPLSVNSPLFALLVLALHGVCSA